MKKLNIELDSNVKTLLIIPTKYHNILYKKLLLENSILFNVEILDINMFLNNVLAENNFVDIQEAAIINKLKLHLRLKEKEHQYANNLNFINELTKLESEFKLSNVETPINFEYPIESHSYDFSKIKTMYEKIIILSYENFNPIHYDLIDNLTTISLDLDGNSSKNLYEHSNIIQMLDATVFEIFNDSSQEALIICDNILQQNYLTSQFQDLGILYQLEQNEPSLKKNHLKSFFNVLDNVYSKYDITNISLLFKLYNNDLENFISEINNCHQLNFKEYLKELYNFLFSLELFDVSFINKLFTKLYLLENLTNKTLFNNLLFETLSTKILDNEVINNANMLIASSNFNSLFFNKVYIIDASLNNFSSKKASYLISTLEREEISNKLISNAFYTKSQKQAEKRLINCANSIDIHYALINLENKPQSLAFFIDSLSIEISKNNNYSHLTTKSQKNKIDIKQINRQLLNKHYLNNQLTISASSMDTFFKCPYQYFIRYILKPSFLDELNNITLGNIYHCLIEKINYQLIDNNHDILKLDIPSLVKLYLNEELNNFDTKYNISVENLEILKYKISKVIILHYTTLKYMNNLSDFTIDKIESEIQYIYNDTIIKGKIDTTMSYKDYSYVIDYKSSSQKFDEKKLSAGISNQLVIYLYLLKSQKRNLMGAFFKPLVNNYIKSTSILDTENNHTAHQKKNLLDGILINNPYLENFDNSFKNQLSSEISTSRFKDGRKKETIIDVEKILEYFNILESNFDVMLENINNATFEIFPYDEISCTYCSYQNICKVSNFQRYRKELENE